MSARFMMDGPPGLNAPCVVDDGWPPLVSMLLLSSVALPTVPRSALSCAPVLRERQPPCTLRSRVVVQAPAHPAGAS